MDKKWTALVPQRHYVVSAKTGKPLLAPQPRLIGRLPESAYLLIYFYLPLCDAVSLARSCRKVAALAQDDRVWRRKLSLLDYKGPISKEAERILEGIAKKASEKEELAKTGGGGGTAQASLGRSGKQSIDLTRSSASGAPRKNSLTAARASTSSASAAAIGGSSSSNKRGSVLQPSATKTPTIPESSTLGSDDALFGDFVDFSDAGRSPNGIDTSHFASISLDDPFAEGSSARIASPARLAPSAKRKEEDLLMLFDDEEDMGLATASPAKPPLSGLGLTRSQSISRSQPGQNGKASPAASSAALRQSVSLTRNGSISAGTHYSSPAPYHDLFVAYYTTLLPYFTSLKSFTTSSLIFTSPHLTHLTRAQLFSTLSRLCQHPCLQPTGTRNSASLQLVRRNLQSSIDHFEASMLSNFEKAADGNLLAGMKDAAQALWELNGGGSVVQVFFNKIPLFYDQSWDPMRNLTKQIGPMGEAVDGIDFAAMDSFMNHVLAIVAREGRTIAKVFPQDSDVLVQFADRIANDVISDYIVPLLSEAQDLPNPLFLLTNAATFGQCSRLIDTVLAIEPRSSAVTHSSVSAVVFEMFEPHMASYLAQEGEWAREYLIGICTEWDTKIAAQNAARDGMDPTFLTAQNPQMVKRNVLAQFGKALLLPVTIVPKTVVFGVNALTAGGTMAFNAMSGGFIGAQSQKALATTPDSGTPGSRPERTRTTSTTSLPTSPPKSLASSSGTAPIDFSGFQMLLSIETAMQLVQADRDCLKRVQTFEGYTGKMGTKVKSAIEEVFIVLCQTLAESHLQPAFGKATDLMGSYKPAEHAADDSLAPLVQFFELVHIGDTIAQMVQVYYDRELSKYVDRNDFLSPVVREKKRFENALDESVASGLNAGLQILMTQAEYILSTRQDPRDFSPELIAGDDGSGGAAGSRKGSMAMLVDIEGPTNAAEAVVDCLKSHCDMLKGSTDKAILEVFHQEVGLRLHGMLLKHLKRSIVSISGGFQVIADLNLYTSFISSMKLPNVQPYFTALKMAANVFIIDSAKDLGSMARDLERYEGTLRIEDIMELVRCRTDWKKIEREVEKEVFGFKAEDCSIQ